MSILPLFTSFSVATFRRELAPHLKPLLGPWWFSQFDSVYEVSQAAKRSFQVYSVLSSMMISLCAPSFFVFAMTNISSRR